MSGSVLTHVERDKFIAGGEKAGSIPVKLTKAENDKMQIAQAYLLVNLPFFADLLLSRLALVPTRDVPIAATDGFAVFVNPDTFFKYTVKEQAFILAHEVMHCIWNDTGLMHVWSKTGKVHCPGGVYDYDPDMMNKAADYVINALLIHGDVGAFNKDWLFNGSYSAKGEESCVVVYEKLMNEPKPTPPPQGQGQGQPGQGQGSGNPPGNQPSQPEKGPGGTPRQFDRHMKPGEGGGQDPDKATEKRSDGEWRVAVAAAAQSAKSQGKLPANFNAFIGEILAPKVAWQERIRSALVRRIGNDGYDFARLDDDMLNRPEPYDMICFPAPTAYGCGTLVIGYDTSGSCVNPEVQQRFFSEMGGIVSDLNPRELHVVWCDAKVQRVDTMEEPEDLVQLKREIDELGGAPGGGGTSFVPVFEKIAEMGWEPDALVYLTDLAGTFPAKSPSYPTIWASIEPDMRAPFGDVVEVEL